MQTRRQTAEQKQFRPDAFSSSVEHERGLVGNLVAARCRRLTDAEEIAMLWWIQQLSWRDGGITIFSESFLAENAARIGTPAMHKFGMRKGQIYDADQVRVVRKEIRSTPYDLREDKFPLIGERPVTAADFLNAPFADRWPVQKQTAYPKSYPVTVFIEECQMGAEAFAGFLMQAAVDPGAPSLRDGLWNFQSLWEALTEWKNQEVAAAKDSVVETAVTRVVWEELDFALLSRSFILIEGREGIGKTDATKAWCGQHPGQAVYVRLESGTDESTLYRSIARAIGTACSYGRKANEMKLRIQDALQSGQLMLVLDEAHFLWPQSDRSARSAPKRLDWLRTALIDFGVPVALISTPQYFARACEKFYKGGWNANQIQRRLTNTVALPDCISATEMKAVAKRYFPKATNAELTKIAVAAATEMAFLTVFLHLRKRVDFIAKKHPNLSESDCIDEALSAYASAVAKPTASPAAAPAALVPAAATAPAGRLHGLGNAAAATVHPRGTSPESLSRIDRAEASLTVS